MFRYVVLILGVLVVASVLLALLISALMLIAMACAIGIPLYLAGRNWLRNSGLLRPVVNPVEHLQKLYIEGKIDLFELERRVAQHIRVEN